MSSSICGSSTSPGHVAQAQAAEGLRSASSASSSDSSSCSRAHVGRPTLENLPQALQAEIFTYLPYRMLSLSRSIRHSIRKIPRPAPPVAALKHLAEYRSPSSLRGVALENVNAKIYVLNQAIRAAHAPQSTRVANANASASASASQPIPTAALTDQTLEQMENTLKILQASKLPNDAFPPHVLNLIAGYAPTAQSFHPEYSLTAFGPDKWNWFIGEVQYVPSPSNIANILAKRCPVFGKILNKIVGETHLLTYIPPEVDGQPLTLNRFMDYIKQPKNGGKPIELNIYWKEILKTYGDQPLPSGWFLVLKTCLPGTKGEIHPEQQAALKEFQKINLEYRELHPMVAAVSIITEYIQSGDSDTCLFSDEYTRTSEVLQGRRLEFGGRDLGDLYVSHCYSDDDAIDDLGLGVVLPCESSTPATPPHILPAHEYLRIAEN